jgi:hypothetical protein
LFSIIKFGKRSRPCKADNADTLHENVADVFVVNNDNVNDINVDNVVAIDNVSRYIVHDDDNIDLFAPDELESVAIIMLFAMTSDEPDHLHAPMLVVPSDVHSAHLSTAASVSRVSSTLPPLAVLGIAEQSGKRAYRVSKNGISNGKRNIPCPICNKSVQWVSRRLIIARKLSKFQCNQTL